MRLRVDPIILAGIVPARPIAMPPRSRRIRRHEPSPNRRARFDPRPRMEGDSGRAVAVGRTFGFRSTPPHGGRRMPHRRHRYCRAGVSIHAPAWRATSVPVRLIRPAPGFDPRPRMEGDCATGSTPIPGPVFRSTPPHGGRRLDAPAIPRFEHVSIHAPAWGATSVASTSATPAQFRSTPPHGGRPGAAAPVIEEHEFRSTPPHGGRPASVPFFFKQWGVSIHAPAWRATMTLDPVRQA